MKKSRILFGEIGGNLNPLVREPRFCYDLLSVRLRSLLHTFRTVHNTITNSKLKRDSQSILVCLRH